jgi:hypothetical protein
VKRVAVWRGHFLAFLLCSLLSRTTGVSVCQLFPEREYAGSTEESRRRKRLTSWDIQRVDSLRTTEHLLQHPPPIHEHLLHLHRLELDTYARPEPRNEENEASIVVLRGVAGGCEFGFGGESEGGRLDGFAEGAEGTAEDGEPGGIDLGDG